MHRPIHQKLCIKIKLFCNELTLLCSLGKIQFFPEMKFLICTVDELTVMPRFSSYFCIWPLMISAFLFVCWSIKAFASVDNCDSLPERGKLARVLVVCNFFTMMCATLGKVTLKASSFKTKSDRRWSNFRF